ncbi:hypothetical protein [Desulfatiferula olefinivorans]
MRAYARSYRIHAGILSGLMALIMTASGCGLSRGQSADMAAAAQALSNNQTPRGMVALAEESMKTAHDEALDYYAPTFLSTAEKHLKKAQSLMIKGGDDVTVAAEALAARKAIAQGLVVKQTVIRQLSDVFAMKDRLDQLKADVHARDDYDRRMDQIRKLIACIEKGDQTAVDKKKPEALEDMRALEVAVVKKVVLAEARDYLARARKIDAGKLSPKTWKTAEDTLQRARVFIESFPRDEAGVAKAGKEALLACRHAYFVTREVITIREMDKDAFENLVLNIETMLDRVRLGLEHEDVRHMSLHDQSVALASSAEALSRKLSACSREPLSVAVLPVPAPTAAAIPSPEPVEPSVAPEPAPEPDPTEPPTLADDLSPVNDEGVEPVTPDSITPDPAATTAADPAPVESPDENLDPATAPMEDLYLTDEEREQLRLNIAPAVDAAPVPTEPNMDLPASSQTVEPLDTGIPAEHAPGRDATSIPPPPTPLPLPDHAAAFDPPATPSPPSI